MRHLLTSLLSPVHYLDGVELQLRATEYNNTASIIFSPTSVLAANRVPDKGSHCLNVSSHREQDWRICRAALKY